MVDKQLVAKVTIPDISAVDGAALANSAAHAVHIVDKVRVKPSDRVLVLGGSGGVGTIVLQLLKSKGVGFLATTST